jgi:hypothetical protein
LPNPETARFIIPSYASHVVLEHTADKETAARTTVKVYRMQHNTMSVEEFVNWRKRAGMINDPYHPSTYRAYFLGEFDARGNLLNPQEPMLYWLVPVLPKPGGPSPGDPNRRDFLDFLSYHALVPQERWGDTKMEDLDGPSYKDRLFNWHQLR